MTISGRSAAATAGSTHAAWPPFSEVKKEKSLPDWYKPKREESSEESGDEAEDEVEEIEEATDQEVDDTVAQKP